MAATLVAAACSKRDAVPTAPPFAQAAPAAAAPLALPDVLAGFSASPAVTGPDYVRRTYSRGVTRVDATLARSVQLGPSGFDAWLATSRAGFPQAALDAPANDVNGFYQCNEAQPPGCDLLIQTRSGVHLELRGGGTSRRQDVDALAAALPLRSWR